MVFFTCNACGESLKKAAVEKHYMTKCRACEVLSCLDCGKDFHGDAYKEHTACITEDQKYGGKNFKAAPNKGMVKQTGWLETVREASTISSLNPKVRDTLKHIVHCGHDNIPRKRNKFVNFLQNSLHIHERWLVEQVWDAIESHSSSQKKTVSESAMKKEPHEEVTCKIIKSDAVVNDGSTNGESGMIHRKEKKKKHKQEEKSPIGGDESRDGRRPKRQGDPLMGQGDALENNQKEMEQYAPPKKKKKKSRKELLSADDASESQTVIQNGVSHAGVQNGVMFEEDILNHIGGEERDLTGVLRENGGSKSKKKQKKKKKHEEENEMGISERKVVAEDTYKNGEDMNGISRAEESGGLLAREKKRKKKKHKKGENDEDESSVVLDDAAASEQEEPRLGGKFLWEAVIIEVLQKAGGEISLKKLKKKVLSEYHSRGGEPSITTEEKLFSKFNKKVTKNPKFKIHKEMVELKH